MKVQHIVGIDFSDKTLDLCVLKNGQIESQLVVSNTLRAIRKFFKDLIEQNSGREGILVCAEHTGICGEKTCVVLEALDITYFMVPAIEINRSMGLVRGKSDRADARKIAEYCQRFRDRLIPSKLPEQHLQDMKDLFVFRQSVVRRRTAKKNQLTRMKKALKSRPRNLIIQELKEAIDRDDKLIMRLNSQLVATIKSNQETWENYKLITSVRGIGKIVACYLIITTENFCAFTDARKYSSYAGVAPFEHKSGSSIQGKTRTSKYRNHDLKTLLINGVNSAIKGSNEMSKYYHRKLAEGKHKNVVKNAIAFKIIGRAFAVVKRKSPYIETYQNIIAA